MMHEESIYNLVPAAEYVPAKEKRYRSKVRHEMGPAEFHGGSERDPASHPMGVPEAFRTSAPLLPTHPTLSLPLHVVQIIIFMLI